MHGTLMTLMSPTVYASSSLVRKQANAFVHVPQAGTDMHSANTA